ncbi:hypothetical protein Q3G72_031241 [Acer saccharum]|nr:hypothetical protein Q3G72_031241 [Acer saccharum]
MVVALELQKELKTALAPENDVSRKMMCPIFNGLEDEWVALNGLEDFATGGEAEFAVELAGIVETKDALGLFGEELLGLSEESEGGVMGKDGFQARVSGGVGLDRPGAG